jgi:hypothetical protein
MATRVFVLVALAACGSTNDLGPHVAMDFARPHGVFDAPVPADDLRPSSTADIAIPNPQGLPIIDQMFALLADNDGFATTGGVFFQISTALDPGGLPTIAQSATAAATAFVVGIDPAAPDYGVRYPLEVSVRAAAGRYGVPNLVTLLPLQGTPLRAGTRYAAILTTALHATTGEPLAAAPADALARFPDATAALVANGVALDQVAGITAFTTGNPGDALATVRSAALARALPAIDTPFVRTDVFDDFCVYHTTIAMPDWQAGVPPFSSTGGTWTFDASGAPIFERSETANLVVTIPRTPAASTGYPLVVFVRTGGGGDRPLVDRGQQPGEGLPALVPGEGPARYFARAGFAGIEVDGPLGGLRNTTDGDEQFLTFNIANLGALRDNVRESAVEIDVIAHVAIALELDTSACAGASTTATFDATHVAIMGHSMGAWIAPLAVAAEPLFRAMILSGAGGSWIENIIYKQKPLAPYPVVSSLLQDSDLEADDPMMTIAQWALEPADPQIYGAAIIREPVAAADPRHVLMVQGVVDDYILPRIANATSLSFGLDLAGAEYDSEADPRLDGELPVGPLLPLTGHTTISLPAAANAHSSDGRIVTAVVTQHLEDGIEDGHEVMFQTDPPKHEVQCFLASWLATGTPSVPVDASRDAPCP